MMLSALTLALELFVIASLALVAYRRPKMTAAMAVTAAMGLGAQYRDATPVAGTTIVDGRSEMRAAVFSPGNSAHDVAVGAGVPIARSHLQNQVFVKVTAAGINPSNFKINLATIPFVRHMTKYHVVGYDFVGEVRSVGSAESCQQFRVGDRIYGVATGSMAEFATAMCSMAGPAPRALSDQQVASLPVAAFTSLEALHRGGLSEGKRVLVIGASGGTGVFGVSIGKALGGHVTGICSGRNKEFVAGFGPDRLVDYTSDAEMNALIAEGQQYDMIYDTVTSFAPEDPNYEPTMRPLLLPGGKYVAINGEPLDWVRGALDGFVAAPLLGFSGLLQRKDYDLFLLYPHTDLINELTALFDGGLLGDVPIDSTFDLTQDGLNSAFEKLKGRRVRGKIVINI